MEKNIIVLDELGNQLGFTYAKRAKGLVKNGRAEYLSDCTIRILNTHAPAILDESMEVREMSKILCFNAREFVFDKTNQGNNVGSRMFVTDIFGENVEAYEIGDRQANRTQICCEKVLERNTDYVFRFAMTENGRGGDCFTSQFVIMPIRGEEGTDEDWENRYVYNLAESQYKPQLNKRWGSISLRVYEIPFSTGDIERFRFVFVENQGSARIYPVKENEAYNQFPDYTGYGWLNEKKDQIEKFDVKGHIKDLNVDETMRGVGETVKNVVDKFAQTVFSVSSNAFFNQDHKNVIRKSGECFDGNGLAVILQDVQNQSGVEFAHCNIADVDNAVDGGAAVMDMDFNILSTNIGGKSFLCLLRKVGDGCNVELANANVGGMSAEQTYNRGSFQRCQISVRNAIILSSSFGILMQALGDNCMLSLQNVNIIEDGTDPDYGNTIRNTQISISNLNASEYILAKLQAKLGEGCNVTGI